eukprot:TRINITY_DN20077_c0_g1_i1.p1 TRINITY_DN20077_c0_g1~~TRINITY_DN20077_c0_g1_i1.p1  ORF type:complete len:411 (+),score=110.16 TRINITY_DN20077_c0_g1_i1:75-1307(+)
MTDIMSLLELDQFGLETTGDKSLSEDYSGIDWSLDSIPIPFLDLTPESSPNSSPFDVLSSPASFGSDTNAPYSSSDEENTESMMAENIFSDALSSPIEVQDHLGGELFGQNSILLPSMAMKSESAFKTSSLPPLPIVTVPFQSIPIKDSEEPVKEKKATRTKRRRTDAKSKKVNKDFVELSQDELLKLTSAEMEDYMSELFDSRSVPPSEEKELKRIRRLIKNREYAQSSRNKKKQHVDVIQQQLNEAIAQRDHFAQQCQQLQIENQGLKLQLTKIGTALKSDPVIIERLKSKSSTGLNKAVNKAAAITLFAVLFSFAIFSSNLPFSVSSSMTSSKPSLLPTDSTLQTASSNAFNSRSLQGVDFESPSGDACLTDEMAEWGVVNATLYTIGSYLWENVVSKSIAIMTNSS